MRRGLTARVCRRRYVGVEASGDGVLRWSQAAAAAPPNPRVTPRGLKTTWEVGYRRDWAAETPCTKRAIGVSEPREEIPLKSPSIHFCQTRPSVSDGALKSCFRMLHCFKPSVMSYSSDIILLFLKLDACGLPSQRPW